MSKISSGTVCIRCMLTLRRSLAIKRREGQILEHSRLFSSSSLQRHTIDSRVYADITTLRPRWESGYFSANGTGTNRGNGRPCKNQKVGAEAALGKTFPGNASDTTGRHVGLSKHDGIARIYHTQDNKVSTARYLDDQNRKDRDAYDGAGPNTYTTAEAPHRRRKRRKTEESLGRQPESSRIAGNIHSHRANGTDIHFLPTNSASKLAAVSAELPRTSLRRLMTSCLSLSKPRLSFLIVLTTASAYSLYPVPDLLLPSTTASPSLSALTLVFLTSGTFLCSASANALNMLLEPQYDAQMSRTRNRPLVRGLIGKPTALTFASLAAGLGSGALYYGVNPTVAFLGALNIGLYAGVYTPLKRSSVINTWVGAVVGAIPPLMGWAAAAGQSATGTGSWRELLFDPSTSLGGWLLAALLFAWQFPHFNSLSWPIREEYRAAGYRMLAWTNPRRNGRVALRYALLCFPICAGLWYAGITDQGFLLTSSIVNTWMAREAWRFWRHNGYKGSARGLFWASVWHLPVVMVLAMVHKQGLWEDIWYRWQHYGQVDDDENENRDQIRQFDHLLPVGEPVSIQSS